MSGEHGVPNNKPHITDKGKNRSAPIPAENKGELVERLEAYVRKEIQAGGGEGAAVGAVATGKRQHQLKAPAELDQGDPAPTAQEPQQAEGTGGAKDIVEVAGAVSIAPTADQGAVPSTGTGPAESAAQAEWVAGPEGELPAAHHQPAGSEGAEQGQSTSADQKQKQQEQPEQDRGTTSSGEAPASGGANPAATAAGAAGEEAMEVEHSQQQPATEIPAMQEAEECKEAGKAPVEQPAGCAAEAGREEAATASADTDVTAAAAGAEGGEALLVEHLQQAPVAQSADVPAPQDAWECRDAGEAPSEQPTGGEADAERGVYTAPVVTAAATASAAIARAATAAAAAAASAAPVGGSLVHSQKVEDKAGGAATREGSQQEPSHPAVEEAAAATAGQDSRSKPKAARPSRKRDREAAPTPDQKGRSGAAAPASVEQPSKVVRRGRSTVMTPGADAEERPACEAVRTASEPTTQQQPGSQDGKEEEEVEQEAPAEPFALQPSSYSYSYLKDAFANGKERSGVRVKQSAGVSKVMANVFWGGLHPGFTPISGNSNLLHGVLPKESVDLDYGLTACTIRLTLGGTLLAKRYCQQRELRVLGEVHVILGDLMPEGHEAKGWGGMAYLPSGARVADTSVAVFTADFIKAHQGDLALQQAVAGRLGEAVDVEADAAAAAAASAAATQVEELVKSGRKAGVAQVEPMKQALLASPVHARMMRLQRLLLPAASRMAGAVPADAVKRLLQGSAAAARDPAAALEAAAGAMAASRSLLRFRAVQGDGTRKLVQLPAAEVVRAIRDAS